MKYPLITDPGGRDTPYNGLYRKAPPEKGTFFWLQVYAMVGILIVEVYERVGKSVIWVCGKGPKGRTDEFYGFIESGKRSKEHQKCCRQFCNLHRWPQGWI